MSKNHISIFEKKNINSIYVDNEILFKVDELLKSFIIKNSFNVERLIDHFKKKSPNLKIKKLKISSSKYDYYVNTINALRIILFINSKETNEYREWLIKCGMERINEIINPEIIYDRLKTILYKKGIKKEYDFIKSDFDKLNNKINYVELNQNILNEDISDDFYNNYSKDSEIIEIIKLPRIKNTTNFL